MSLTKTQQSVYRPLVEKAWITHCKMTGTSPNNQVEYRSWYEDNLISCTGHRSTREADPSHDFQPLLDRFMLLAGDPQPVTVKGWSPRQNEWFNKAAGHAFNIAVAREAATPGISFPEWVTGLLETHGIKNHVVSSKTVSFDDVMASLGIISGDERIISHFSAASERRIRWQLERYMTDLSWLESKPVTWDYISAIWDQAELLPTLCEAPASTLLKVLQMLDTHIRRLCKTRGIRTSDLPTR